MSLEFVKMHGCGNDFVLLDGPQDLAPARVRAICDRRTGVGADGVIVVGPRDAAAWPVVVHNSDGSLADACGNGYRCVARYLLEREGGLELDLRTPGGLVRCRRAGEHYAVELPAPQVEGPVALRHGGRLMDAWSVRVGNPNVVVLVDDPEACDLVALADGARAVAGPANVGAVAVRGPSEITLRVHERGAGETLACGTGSCAAVAATREAGHVGPGTVRVGLRGGTLEVTPGTERWVLSGPAEYAYVGRLG